MFRTDENVFKVCVYVVFFYVVFACFHALNEVNRRPAVGSSGPSEMRANLARPLDLTLAHSSRKSPEYSR
jgi:hypothetical protein